MQGGVRRGRTGRRRRKSPAQIAKRTAPRERFVNIVLKSFLHHYHKVKACFSPKFCHVKYKDGITVFGIKLDFALVIIIDVNLPLTVSIIVLYFVRYNFSHVTCE